MEFRELKEAAEQMVEEEIKEKGKEMIAERIKEIKNLEKALAAAREQLEDLMTKTVEDEVEI